MQASKFSSVHYDSRLVEPGSVFVAIKGEKSDGHSFIESAINKGAKAIVYEDDAKLSDLKSKFTEIEFIKVNNAREELARLSYEFFNRSADQISIIAVTGTNGKTTVTHLIQSLVDKTALLGTMGLKLSPGAEYKDMDRTTPQSKELFETIDELVKNNFAYLTMEVSSHALDQYRVSGAKFKTAIVTNLTQDHLDYHLTMENYFKAKAKIFSQTTDCAILNVDDEYYSRFRAEAEKFKLKIVTIGINQQADFMAQNISFSNAGLSYELEGNKITMKLNGMFNVYNSLFAIAAARLENISWEHINKVLADTQVVAGRFEVVQEGNSPMCIVDYAHSPDGLMNVLKGARALMLGKSDSKLICLFGCGGDRDMTKRPKMGRIAAEMADKVIVTSDNPRSEEPEQIIADILTGIHDMSKVTVIADRKAAIQAAVKTASSKDLVVIAGKGHEDYQILKDKTIHFDDREEVRAAIKN